jgi:hypothetical protein
MKQRSWLRLVLTHFVALAVIVAPLAIREAHAQDATAQARVHFQKGKDLFAKGQYQAAIAEFAAADNLAPAPMLEFNIALCYERLGDRGEALRRYRVYLREMPGAPNRGAVEAKVKRLESELAADRAAAKPASPAEPPPAAEPPPVAEPPPAAEPPPSGEVPPAAEPPPANVAPAPPAAGHSDPELARVAAIDVAAIRDQNYEPGAAPGPGDEPPVAEDGAAPSDGDQGEEEEKPLYKQWWLWVVVGISTIILIDFALSDSSSSSARVITQPEIGSSMPGPQTGGLTWTF